jgi:hypothetical protein
MYAAGVNVPDLPHPTEAIVYEDHNIREIAVSLPGFGVGLRTGPTMT